MSDVILWVNHSGSSPYLVSDTVDESQGIILFMAMLHVILDYLYPISAHKKDVVIMYDAVTYHGSDKCTT